MGFIDDLPIYIVISAVIINLILGIGTGINFTQLMIRSIIVTIVFSIIGFILSSTLKSAAESIKLNKENSSEADDLGSNFDVKVPPIDDEDLIDYSADDEEFTEINPAYLHKTNKNE